LINYQFLTSNTCCRRSCNIHQPKQLFCICTNHLYPSLRI